MSTADTLLVFRDRALRTFRANPKRWSVALLAATVTTYYLVGVLRRTPRHTLLDELAEADRDREPGTVVTTFAVKPTGPEGTPYGYTVKMQETTTKPKQH